MKAKLIGFILLLCSVLSAEVIFYDQFDRPNGAVGNGWTNVGPATSSIENGAMKLISDNNKGIKHEFTAITSGTYYVDFDWKLSANDWLANAFPNDFPTHLLWDYNGDLYRDPDSNMSAPTFLASKAFNTWINIRWKINLDTDRYSIWIDNTLVADNILGNPVSSFFRFTFRFTSGSSTTQYIDNFIIYNEVAPPAPQDFTAQSSVNNITLSWTAVPNPLLVTYRIYRDTTPNPSTLLTETATNTTSYVDALSRANPNTNYYYRIKASVKNIDSAFSSSLGPLHLSPQISVNPQNITFNVGYGYADSTEVTIGNSGNYPLEWNVSGAAVQNNSDIVYAYLFDGNFNDSSSLSLIPSNTNVSLTADRFGVANRAARFNGNSYLRTYQNIPETNYTQNFWLKTSEQTGGIYCVRNGAGDNDRNFSIRNANISHRLWSEQIITASGINVSNGQWHMITLTVSQTGGQKLYIDGILLVSGTKGQSDFDWQDYYDIGYGVSHNLYPSQYYTGDLDDFILINGVLSPEEIQQIYTNSQACHIVVPHNGTIQPSQTQSIKVHLQSESLQTGTHVDTLYVHSNDPLNPTIPIVITTNVLPPVPEISPEPIEVNINVANPSRQQTIVLSNNGAGKLQYTLSGNDEIGQITQLPSISGFTAMGIFGAHRYYRSNSQMSWTAAKALCEQNGGHLVTIANAEENNFVYQNTIDRSWIGLTDEVSEGTWHWVTDEPVSYTNWDSGQPDNSGNEDYVHIRWSYFEKWNDVPNSYPCYAVLEIDTLPSTSLLQFTPSSGTVLSQASSEVILSVSAAHLSDGIYESSIGLQAEGIAQPILYPVTINVDFTPPVAVSGLAMVAANTNADQIGISWQANDPLDQVVAYKITRKGRDESIWRELGTVPATQLQYIDSQFTGLDSTFVYYKVLAIDWVGNQGSESEALMAALERFPAPANLSIELLNNNRDAHLSWNPVTHTIAGTPATPSCYLVYTSNKATPTSDFVFHSITTTNEFTHPYVYFFVPQNRVFYIVTAYGGSLGRLQTILNRKQQWTKAELQKELMKEDSGDNIER